MNSLYIANCDELYNSKWTNDIGRWSSLYNMIAPSISIVDRCNSIKMPFRFKTFEMFNMPKDISNFSLSYEECCLARAQELVDLSDQLSKPITILYSGGIDSTTALVAFMRILNEQELREKVRVALSIESIDENVNFYYDHIRSKCNIVSSEYMSSMIDGSSIVVGGEHNDQLFGSDIIGQIQRNGDYDNIHKPYSRQFITSWFQRSLTVSESNFWYDLLDNHIKTQAPCEVTTNFHFFWWYNFCFKWQNVYFRILTRVDKDMRYLINDRFLKNNYHHFFSSQNFQKWSMLNHDLKIQGDWTGYKAEAKKFIFEYNKDKEYRDYKIKAGSLYRLFLQKKFAVAITDNFQILDTVNADDFYEPNNSFT